MTQSLFYVFCLENHPPLMLPHTSVPITDRSQLTGTRYRYLFFESYLWIVVEKYLQAFALTRSLGLSESLCGYYNYVLDLKLVKQRLRLLEFTDVKRYLNLLELALVRRKLNHASVFIWGCSFGLFYSISGYDMKEKRLLNFKKWFLRSIFVYLLLYSLQNRRDWNPEGFFLNPDLSFRFRSQPIPIFDAATALVISFCFRLSCCSFLVPTVSQSYWSGSFPFLIKVLSGLK